MICLHSVLQLSPLFLKLFHHLTQKLCTHQVITSYSSQPQDPVKFCFTSCVYEFLYSRYPIQVVTNATSAFLCLIWVVARVRTSFLFFFWSKENDLMGERGSRCASRWLSDFQSLSIQLRMTWTPPGVLKLWTQSCLCSRLMLLCWYAFPVPCPRSASWRGSLCIREPQPGPGLKPPATC